MRRLDCVAMLMLAAALASGGAQTPTSGEPRIPAIRNAAGVQLVVAPENVQPTLRIVLPGEPASDRTFDVLFPEHVTVVRPGSNDGERLYMFQPGQRGARPTWRSAGTSLEYERDLPSDVHLLARATLEDDGVRIHYEFTNRS